MKEVMTMRKIVCTPGTCSGSPRIDGTRLTCANVVTALADNGLTIMKYLSIYPYLTIEDIKECATYCAAKKCVCDNPANYCSGCSLDLRPEVKPTIFIDNNKINKYINIRHNTDGYAYLGSKDDYIDNGKSLDVWLLAKEVLRMICGKVAPCKAVQRDSARENTGKSADGKKYRDDK
jgi:uncharacterized protein (DUF433 family)